MTRHRFMALVPALVVTASLFVGCGHKEGDSHARTSDEAEPAHETEAGVTFSAKHGLLVSPETAKFIGLQVTDVEERKIAATLQFSARVYRAADEARSAALASGNVSLADAAGLSEGQTVSVQSAGRGAALPGRIITVKRDLEKASGQVEVLLAIADAQPPLAAGAFVSVTVPIGGETSVASVPCSALLRTTEGDCVYTVNGDYFARTVVKLGLTDGEFTEVTDGLFAGDKVVAHPVMTLWMTELHNVNGGDACCIAPEPGK